MLKVRVLPPEPVAFRKCGKAVRKTSETFGVEGKWMPIRYGHLHRAYDYCMERKQPSPAKISNWCVDSEKRRQVRKTSRNTTNKHMKSILITAALAFLFVACDARVTPAGPDKVIEKNTTIITPPAKEEKKVENNTTIINPPAAKTTEEKKTTTTTTTK